jgi:hypothetical protein
MGEELTSRREWWCSLLEAYRGEACKAEAYKAEECRAEECREVGCIPGCCREGEYIPECWSRKECSSPQAEYTAAACTAAVCKEEEYTVVECIRGSPTWDTVEEYTQASRQEDIRFRIRNPQRQQRPRG